MPSSVFLRLMLAGPGGDCGGAAHGVTAAILAHLFLPDPSLFLLSTCLQCIVNPLCNVLSGQGRGEPLTAGPGRRRRQRGGVPASGCEQGVPLRPRHRFHRPAHHLRMHVRGACAASERCTAAAADVETRFDSDGARSVPSARSCCFVCKRSPLSFCSTREHDVPCPSPCGFWECSCCCSQRRLGHNWADFSFPMAFPSSHST